MKKFISIFILLFFCFSGYSQIEIIKSEETIVINNKKYYVHKVESGQTLYSICKAYNVPQKEVAKTNNLHSFSINAGQILNIPVVINEENNSPEFYSHKVIQGETLFSLAKKYEVSINDIIKHNPEARYGIKTDQILKIPNINKENPDNINSQIYYYTVEKGNTLFSISQKFGISIDKIISLNPETENGIKIGQVLKIPKSGSDISEIIVVNNDSVNNQNNNYSHLYFEDENITPCNKFEYDKTMTFNIVLMLPLFLNRNIYYLGNYKEEKDQMFYKNTQRFIEIYEGILIALNKLKSQGLSLNLSVYDTENDGKKVKDIMDELNYPEIDLIIGPVYSGNIKIASHYAKKHHINLISPLSQNKDLIYNNPFVFQVVPSNEIRIKKTSDMYIGLRDTSILIIHNGTENENKLIEVYKTNLLDSFSIDNRATELSLKTVNFSTGGDNSVEDALTAGTDNIIIIPSDDEVFVTQVIDKLYTLTEDYQIRLVGSPRWENFQNININHLKSMSFHYISPIFINYHEHNVKVFITEYRAIYETEPSKHAFQGFDIMCYFVNTLRKYGRHFQFCLLSSDTLPNKKGIVYDFDFIRTNKNGGFENNGTFFLEYDENFQLKKVNIKKELEKKKK
ncbi:MAG: LysM peptidoglycan-binding domain-containing protein [Bacteroidales bacterium]|nr:LysM peptidoglycan-binding domain-containing protein [Bacteroidales bacterium]